MTNAERAEHVNQCIMHYEQITKVEREDALKDFLASAMHWADEQGVDFYEDLRIARMNYDAEVEEEHQQRASLINFTIVYTDLSGDVYPYNLEASNHADAKTKFLADFPDGVNSIDYVIAHEASPGYKQLHEKLSEMVESGELEDASVANLLANLTRIP